MNQKWECPKCKRTYVPPPAFPVLEVRCSNKHGSAGSAMRLVEGEMPAKRKPMIHSPSGPEAL